MKAAFMILFVALFLSGCGVELGNSSKGDSQSSEEQSFGDNANVNQPDVDVIAGGNAEVGAGLEVTITHASGEDATISADCDKLIGPGFKWKANSERDGNLVILTPAEILAPALICVEFAEAEECAEPEINGANGNRAHYRYMTPGQQALSAEACLDVSCSETCEITPADAPEEEPEEEDVEASE